MLQQLSFKHSKPCTYCGVLAGTKDHFIPQSFARSIAETMDENNFWRQKLLPACLECNSTAGNKVFLTIEEKRQYIQDRYKIKYKKLLTSPEWSKEELSELGSKLRTHVLVSQEFRKIVEERISWVGVDSSDGIDVPKKCFEFWMNLLSLPS